eukprot:6037247-Amphidinium_carterae.1
MQESTAPQNATKVMSLVAQDEVRKMLRSKILAKWPTFYSYVAMVFSDIQCLRVRESLWTVVEWSRRQWRLDKAVGQNLQWIPSTGKRQYTTIGVVWEMCQKVDANMRPGFMPASL